MSGDFTPGNWRCESADRGSTYVVRVTAPHYTGRGEVLARHIQRREDAYLIAASRDLHEALKAIQLFCDDPAGGDDRESLAMGLSRLLPAARAALAKAEGREPSKDPTSDQLPEGAFR